MSVDLGVNHFADPGDHRRRAGEVCMVVRRPSGRIPIFRKTFYPPCVYRLPTGGIREGEGIFEALERELHEETSLRVGDVRFLALVGYQTVTGGPDPVTFTCAFLLDAPDGPLTPLDAAEQVDEFKDIAPDELVSIA